MTNGQATIGRLLRSATSGYVFGCSVPEPAVPLFGTFVKAPAQRGQSEVIGVIYNITIEDDPFVKQMVAAPDLRDEYIEDQRSNRQVPIEVSVLAVGYRNGGGFAYGLPPQPPITLDRIFNCTDDEVREFTSRQDYLRLLIEARDLGNSADELIVDSLQYAARTQPDKQRFLREAGKELARLLGRDLNRLGNILRRLR